jgi:hypothetical protein
MSAMRLTSLMTTFTASALGLAMGLGLAAGVLVLPVPASAADDEVPLDSKIFRGILEGLGLRKDGEAINYQERAPLVIPQGRTLPPPEKAGAALANNPAWPKDPDVKRKKMEIDLAAKRGSASDLIQKEERPMREEDMTPGPKPRTPTRSQPTADGLNDAYGNRLSPDELGTKKGLFSKMFGKKDDEETAKFTGERPRTSLTEPPPGYQTPSPDQPYGLGKDNSKPKPFNYEIDRATQ